MVLFQNSGFKNINLLNGDTMPLIKVGQCTTPSTPFIWYREEQLLAPIELIARVEGTEIVKLIGSDKMTGIRNNDCFIIIQRNVLEDANLYICNHSYGYYTQSKNLNLIKGEHTMTIGPKYNHTFVFEGIVNSLDSTINAPWLNKMMKGGAHIHDMAYSPPGVFNFKVDKSSMINKFIASLFCAETGTSYTTLFILINDFDPNKKGEIDGLVNSTIKSILKDMTID